MPLLESEIPNSLTNSVSGAWPRAAITVSTEVVNSEPSIGMGRGRPLASGSPSFIFTHSILASLPFSGKKRVGVVRNSIGIPSSSTAAVSSAEAGISLRERRYTIFTSSVPRRFAVLAQSTAVFPPPITAVFFPTSTFSPRFTARRNLIPSITPGSSSPSTLSLIPP